MYIKMFDYFDDYSSQKQTMKIMRNIVDSFKANDDLVSEYLKNRFNMALTNNEIYTMVDRQNLKFQDNESVKCLIEILTQVLKNAIFDVFVAGSDREEVRERLIKKIDIIKQGAVKWYQVINNLLNSYFMEIIEIINERGMICCQN